MLLECIAAIHAAAGFGEQPSEDMLQGRCQLIGHIDNGPAREDSGLHDYLQSCFKMLQCTLRDAPGLQADAAAQVAALAADSASSDGLTLHGSAGRDVPASEELAKLALAVVRMQRCLLRVAQTRIMSTDRAEARLSAVTEKPKQLAEAGLQLLWGYTHVLHAVKAGAAPLQQQIVPAQQFATRQGGSKRSSSSSSSSRRPVLFQLLAIPPVHEKLKFVPPPVQQLYLQALRALLQSQPSGLHRDVHTAADVLRGSLVLDVVRLNYQELRAIAAAAARGRGSAAAEVQDEELMNRSFTQRESDAQALTAPAVLLVIELLQLLAASCEAAGAGQREQQMTAVEQCLRLLMQQLGMLAACPSAGYAVRRAVVLRQSGQQLLQLLRWRMQNIGKMINCSSSSSSSSSGALAAAEGVEDLRAELGRLLQLLMWAAGAWSPLSGEEGGSGC
jgi:hypothetical protein